MALHTLSHTVKQAKTVQPYIDTYNYSKFSFYFNKFPSLKTLRTYAKGLNIVNMHVPTAAQQHNSALILWLVRLVVLVVLRTRKVLPQWPQTTLIPSGWMGSAGWAGCSSGITITGLRLMMRLLSEEPRERLSHDYNTARTGSEKFLMT